MNDDIKQRISSLMDGEIEGHAEDTLDNLMSSRALRDTWWRYHLISDVMNRNVADSIDKEMADRIAEIIAGDNVVVAGHRFLSNRFLKPAAGFAIAASVAAVAILGIQHNAAENPEQANTAQVAEKMPDYNMNVSRYTFPVATDTAVTPVRVEQASDFERNPQLNSYLVNYNEFRTSQNGVQGIIPYVRIIANDEDQ